MGHTALVFLKAHSRLSPMWGSTEVLTLPTPVAHVWMVLAKFGAPEFCPFVSCFYSALQPLSYLILSYLFLKGWVSRNVFCYYLLQVCWKGL